MAPGSFETGPRSKAGKTLGATTDRGLPRIHHRDRWCGGEHSVILVVGLRQRRGSVHLSRDRGRARAGAIIFHCTNTREHGQTAANDGLGQEPRESGREHLLADGCGYRQVRCGAKQTAPRGRARRGPTSHDCENPKGTLSRALFGS